MSGALLAAALVAPSIPAVAGPPLGVLAGAGERPGATRLSFQVSDRIEAKVDVGSGNLLLTVRTLSMPGVNEPIDVNATWNSLHAHGYDYVSRLGLGWTINNSFDVHLVENADGSVTYRAADGLMGVFDPVAGAPGTYLNPAGFKMTLVKTGTLAWTLTEHETQRKLAFAKPSWSTGPQLASVTDRNGNQTNVEYEDNGGPYPRMAIYGPTHSAVGVRARLEVGPGAGPTTTIYHGIGSQSGSLRYVQFTKDTDLDRSTSFTDARGRTTEFLYNGGAVITEIEAPGGVTTSFTYDSERRVTSITQSETSAGGPGSSVTRLAYPSATQTLLAGPNTNQSQSVAAVPHTTYTLDSTQRVTAAVDASGRTRSASYTANFDTATATTGAGGSASTTTNTWGANNGQSLTQASAPSGSTRQWGYGATGMSQYNPTSSTDAAGNQSIYTYNGSGNQLTSTDAGTNQAQLSYNTDGTVATATSPGNGLNVTSYGYTHKQLTSMTPVTGSSLGARAYTYDSLGRLATATNGRGITATYTYNLNDQITQVAFSGTGSGGQSTSFGYDTAGRMNSRTDSTGGSTTATTTWTYDQLGRLTRRETTIPGGGGGGPVTYQYDKASNLTSSTSTIGETVTYAYDDSGVPVSVTYPRPQSGSPGVMRFTVDDQGRRTGTYLQTNSTLSTWAARSRNTYDPSGRVTRVRADTGPGTADKVDITYCYTAGTTPASGCTPSTANARDKLVWRKDNLTGKATTYTYNTSGRLTAATLTAGTGNSFGYGFDARGNRTSATATGTNPSSQSLAFNAANQITTTGYTYDGAGNQTNDPSSNTTAITYTGADQLKNVTKGSNTYTYLHAGLDNVELLRQTAPDGTYRTTYGRTAATGVPVVEQTTYNNGSTTYETSVISDPVTGTPLMLRTDSGTQSMYIFDGTPGAPIALITSASSQAFGYDYDPYGVPTLTQDSGGQGVPQNPFTFAGTGVKDRTTGWVHYANRYYNTRTGTWTQQDTLDAPLDPTNGNRYAYAGGDPINNIDPTGRDSWDCAGAIAAQGIGAGGAAYATLTATGPVGWGFIGAGLALNTVLGYRACKEPMGVD